MMYNKRIVVAAVTAASFLSLASVAFASTKLSPVSNSGNHFEGIFGDRGHKEKVQVCTHKKQKPTDLVQIKRSTSNLLFMSTIKFDDGTENIIINAPAGSVAIYGNDKTNVDFAMSVGIGDEPATFTLDNFPPGKYLVISTTNSDACQSLTKEQCKADAGYIAS
ncbi:MAG: hypothetical protein WCL34_13360, partial [Methylococcaceae bacterium]